MRTNYNLTVAICFFFWTGLLLAGTNGNEKTPFGFTENKGQVSDQYYKPRPDVLFSGTDDKLVFHLKQTGLSYQLTKINSVDVGVSRPAKITAKVTYDTKPEELSIYRLDVNWLNCNTNAIIEKGPAHDGFANYYTEACPQGALGVKSYRQLTYKQLYKGVDLVWYEHSGHLKYDYLVAAGADYTQIQWELIGAENIVIDRNGNLLIKTPLGDLVEESPLVMQDGRQLSANWQVNGNRISFAVKGINPSKPFVIDPLVRLWGTYYGGNQGDLYSYACTDSADNVFISGETKSTANIATIGSSQFVYGGGVNSSAWFWGDSFLVKFNSQGLRQWATYYGGSGSDYGNYCAADANGNVYMVGGTTSTNTNVMATPGCFQPAYGGGNSTSLGDGYIVKFNNAGLRQWGTYYGDTIQDWVLGVCVDPGGNLFVCGATSGGGGNTVFATAGAFQPSLAIGSSTVNSDGFLSKFTTSGQRLWSTYFGGVSDDGSFFCKTDNTGNVYMTGGTNSPNSNIMASSGCHQSIQGGFEDGFLAKFDGTGNRLWSTYYGGENDDYVINCDIDNLNNVYIAGATASSTGIATPGSHQTGYGSAKDIFFARFNASGQRQWGSYYGGNGTEDWGFCTADNNGHLYLSGVTSSNAGTVIATACSYQQAYGGGNSDAFLAKFNNTGNRLWGTYYGGTGSEGFTNNGNWWPTAAMDGQGNVYFGGSTSSSSTTQVIASSGGYQPSYGGGTSDVFLVKFDGCRGIVTPPASNLVICAGKSLSLTTTPACATYWYSGPTGNNLLFPGVLYTGALNSDTTFYAEDLLCGPGLPRTPVTITVMPGPILNLTASNFTVCAGESLSLSVTGATSYSWSGTPSTYSLVTVIPSGNTVYSVIGTGTNGCATTATIAITADACLGIAGNEMNTGLRIYPNPNAGEFTILAPFDIELRITDNLGRLVETIALKKNSGYSISLKNKSSGVYHINGNDGNYKIAQKIIINR